METSISLRRALSVRFFLLALAYMLFMLGVIVFWLMPRLQAIVVHSNESLATALAVQAENYLVAPQRALTLVVERMASRTAKEVPLSSLLDVQVGSSDIFEAVYVLDAHGKITHLGFSSDKPGKDNSRRSRDTFMGLDLSRGFLLSEARRKTQADRSLWSSVFLSAVTGRLAVAVAMPAGDNTVIGEVGLANLSEYFRRIDAAEGVTMMIVDSHGQILAHPDVNVASQQLNVSNLPLLQNTNGSALQTEISRFQGVEVIATRAPIAGVDWAVLVTQPLSTAREPVVTILTVLGVAGLLVAVLSIWLGGFFSARLSAIFEKLVGTAEAVAVGHYPTVWQSSRVAEFTRLIDSLHRMSLAVQERESALSRSQAELMELNQSLEQRVKERTTELMQVNSALQAEETYQKELAKQLAEAQNQLLQSEKMASIGQLAAGLAHEINNPVGFVNSNLVSLKRYVADMLEILSSYETHEMEMPPATRTVLSELKSRLDFAYLRDDVVTLMNESLGGLERVKRIVQDMKDFSHVGTAEKIIANLEQGLDSTLNVVWNELKYKAEVVKEYAGIPEIECVPAQLNQVFLNLLVNAAHAIGEHGRITIRTGYDEANVWVEVADNGCGISLENQKRVFDPFFTTKPVGTGTGLGLSLSYGIVKKHGGQIELTSEPGKGAVFKVVLPRK